MKAALGASENENGMKVYLDGKKVLGMRRRRRRESERTLAKEFFLL
jgi:hypothetical protein